LKPFVDETVIMDDNSPDGTAEEAEAHGAYVVRRIRKLGLGTAYQEGVKEARIRFDPDVLVEMDADLQHPPEDIPKLLAAIGQGADVAIASRYVEGGSSGFGFRRGLISNVANFLARKMLGLRVRDATTAFRAFDREAMDVLSEGEFSSSGFSYEVEVLKRMKDAGMEMAEVPSVFGRRNGGESKLSLHEAYGFMSTVVSLSLSNEKKARSP
jgi:dolichol-phosphate mannosyltransferase